MKGKIEFESLPPVPTALITRGRRSVELVKSIEVAITAQAGGGFASAAKLLAERQDDHFAWLVKFAAVPLLAIAAVHATADETARAAMVALIDRRTRLSKPTLLIFDADTSDLLVDEEFTETPSDRIASATWPALAMLIGSNYIDAAEFAAVNLEPAAIVPAAQTPAGCRTKRAVVRA